jgi:hypothetical protein
MTRGARKDNYTAGGWPMLVIPNWLQPVRNLLFRREHKNCRFLVASAPRNDKKITSWCHPERLVRNLLFRCENEKSRFLPFDFAQGRNDKG